MKIDLNADVGESFGAWTMGDDGAMFDIVTTANVACGFHAGDPEVMRRTAALARSKGVAVGAHPGFHDLLNFGRRRICGITPREIENLVAYQVGAFAAMAELSGHRMTHVKTHGALGNMCNDDEELALAVGRGIKAAAPSALFLVMPGLPTEKAAQKLGLAYFREIYADRSYDDSFNLTDRSRPGAVIHDPLAARDHVLRMLDAGALIATSGKRLPVAIDSICLHGDNPNAVAAARTLRDALEAAGVTIAGFK
ncbi:LamB/YcsF family protein [Bosea sp. (in: a-proteobacteria)]|uniref:LamB/YcsF family protein n=1 Tax=Bosea sp. (in: a-proteobacteria) TaxID=1871050 RepID=UPI00260BAE17|nr:5-oxoprolinase subunit PxpA [Bosea sp. (in: a-proteobacteria)]MCO5089945.1 LamB/YcsF family protein [Bosea sp. (in: a-proteobacteria)]